MRASSLYPMRYNSTRACPSSRRVRRTRRPSPSGTPRKRNGRTSARHRDPRAGRNPSAAPPLVFPKLRTIFRKPSIRSGVAASGTARRALRQVTAKMMLWPFPRSVAMPASRSSSRPWTNAWVGGLPRPGRRVDWVPKQPGVEVGQDLLLRVGVELLLAAEEHRGDDGGGVVPAGEGVPLVGDPAHAVEPLDDLRGPIGVSPAASRRPRRAPIEQGLGAEGHPRNDEPGLQELPPDDRVGMCHGTDPVGKCVPRFDERPLQRTNQARNRSRWRFTRGRRTSPTTTFYPSGSCRSRSLFPCHEKKGGRTSSSCNDLLFPVETPNLISYVAFTLHISDFNVSVPPTPRLSRRSSFDGAAPEAGDRSEFG